MGSIVISLCFVYQIQMRVELRYMMFVVNRVDSYRGI